MTLKEHYKFHSRKSIKPYMVLVLLILLTITIFHTFGGYTATGNGAATIGAAKWLLNINGEQISSNTSSLSSPIQIINSNDGTNNIDIKDECYFDITVNPATTEVAVTYTISINVADSNSTLPEGTTIKKYEKYNSSNSNLISTTNVNSTSVTISDDINLVNDTALSANQAVKYRVYCQMPNYADLVKSDTIGIVPQILVKQIVGNE